MQYEELTYSTKCRSDSQVGFFSLFLEYNPSFHQLTHDLYKPYSEVSSDFNLYLLKKKKNKEAI